MRTSRVDSGHYLLLFIAILFSPYSRHLIIRNDLVFIAVVLTITYCHTNVILDIPQIKSYIVTI
jgi:hypothetical protein